MDALRRRRKPSSEGGGGGGERWNREAIEKQGNVVGINFISGIDVFHDSDSEESHNKTDNGAIRSSPRNNGNSLVTGTVSDCITLMYVDLVCRDLFIESLQLHRIFSFCSWLERWMTFGPRWYKIRVEMDYFPFPLSTLSNTYIYGKMYSSKIDSKNRYGSSRSRGKWSSRA